MPAAGEGQSLVRFVNGTDDTQYIRVVFSGTGENIGFLGATAYRALSVGTVQFTAYSADGAVLVTGRVELTTGEAVTVLIGGQSGYFVNYRVYKD
jgi:hypothetical protein